MRIVLICSDKRRLLKFALLNKTDLAIMKASKTNVMTYGCHCVLASDCSSDWIKILN